MGQTASRVGKGSNGIVVTLDALGTLYKFKKPFAVQYLEIAQQTGVKEGIETHALQQAFRKAYKEQVARHPNYGYETLNGPSEWWNMLVKNTFSQLVRDVPDALPQQLYDHFSTADAYELHHDVRPFLQSLHNLRTQFGNAKGPSILTGIITNSDPRVSQVLRALSLNVGDVTPPTQEELRESGRQSGIEGKFITPWSNAYNLKNDFDFLVTGYEAGAEKPDEKIWKLAELKASFVAASKLQSGTELPEGRFRSAIVVLGTALSSLGKLENMRWIHVGDEYEKDYLGATSAGREALLLDREGSLDFDANKVGDLEEAATIINLMAQEILKQTD